MEQRKYAAQHAELPETMKTTTHIAPHDTFDERTVRDLVCEPLVRVAPDTPVSYALSLLRSKGVRHLAVTYNRKPIGTFSERNLILASFYRPDLHKLTMESVMSTPAVAVPDSMPLFDAYALMAKERINLVTVVDHTGECIGIAPREGILNLLGVSFFYRKATVGDVMSRTVATARRGEPVTSALSRMAETGIACIVLEHERKPIGVLTEHDLSMLILNGTDLATVRLEEGASTAFTTISPSASLDEAVALMNTHETTRLIVVDRNGEIVGILTEAEALTEVESPYLRAWKSVLAKSQEQLTDSNRELRERALFLEQILMVAADTAIIATDLYLKVKYFNEAAAMLLNIKASDAVGMRLPDLFAQARLEQQHFSRGIDAVQRKHKYSYTTDLMRESAHMMLDCWITGIRADDDLLSGFVWTARDVTERRELEENLKRPLVLCKLTGLANRQSLLEILGREINRSGRYGTPFSIIMLDIDHLKTLNDTFGHGVGDDVLKRIATILSTNIRRVDTIGRWSGGEFLIVSPETTESEAMFLAERMRMSIEGYYFDSVGEVTVSGGVAQYRGEDDADALVRKTERALTRAKSRGRNRNEIA